MRKLLLALAACSFLAAGCEIKREGYQFVITTQGQGTVIEGSQANWDLRSGASAPLILPQPGIQPMDGLFLPQ